MNEVRLIIEAARQGHLCPVDLLPRVNGAENSLEAADTAKRLWSQADLAVKQLDKPARAEAGSLGDRRDCAGVRGTAESVERVGYRGMQLEGTGQLRQKRALKNREHGTYVLCGQELLADLAHSPRPKIVERERRIRRFRGREAKERESAARPKLNANHAFLLIGVDDETVCARSREDGAAVALVQINILRVIDPYRIVAKVKNDRRFTVRQQPFFRMRAGRALPIPEALDETRQRVWESTSGKP